MQQKKLLLIEDDQDSLQILTGVLKNIGYSDDNIIHCSEIAQIANVDAKDIEIVLTDLSLTDSCCPETFTKVQNRFPLLPIIVLTGTAEMDFAVKTIQQGAQDYLIKGEFDQKILAKAIQYAIERKEKDADYQRLFENSPVPMYIYDSNSFQFLAVNAAALEQYGYSRERFLSMSAQNIRPPDEVSRFYEINVDVPAEYHDLGRWRHTRQNGEIFFVHIYANRTVFNGIPAAMVQAIDIDKKVKAEVALEEMRNELTSILESITDAFYAVDTEWRFTYVNKEYERIQNRRREDLLGKNIWELFPYGKELRFYQEYQRAMRDQVSVHFEEYNPDNKMWVRVSAYPAPKRLAIYFQDITEEKKIREKIFTDEQNLRAIINNTKDTIWSIDKEYNFLSANNIFWARVQAITGKTQQEVTKWDFDEDLFAEWERYYERAFAGEAYTIIIKEIIDGKTVFEEVSFNPICDASGAIIGISCASHDVTEIQIYLGKIERQNEQLKQIAWVQSHEVRGPVATILGLIQLFNLDDATDPVNGKILHSVKEAAHILDEVIRKINSSTKTTDL